MTVVALVKSPLMSVPRGPKGAVLGLADGHVDDVPLVVTLTEGEIHIAFADRNGPTFAIDLNRLVDAAVTEIETLLGLQQKGR